MGHKLNKAMFDVNSSYQSFGIIYRAVWPESAPQVLRQLHGLFNIKLTVAATLGSASLAHRPKITAAGVEKHSAHDQRPKPTIIGVEQRKTEHRF